MNTAAKIQTTAQRLAIAHNALTKVKRKFTIEDFNTTDVAIEVEFIDQFGNFEVGVIARHTLEAFILDFYSSTIDTCVGGEHVQYDDCSSAYDYLEENTRAVLMDYLNNRKS